MSILKEIVALGLTAAPWLLLGLVTAGVVKGFISEQSLKRWVGGRGVAGISRAAVIGAPLPLCSCGAIPTAVTLYRGGAGRGPTTAFLIGAPGVGVDSMALTYALLGPFMMLARVAGAVVTAFGTGLLVSTAQARSAAGTASAGDDSACCDAGCSGAQASAGCQAGNDEQPRSGRLSHGLRYAFDELYDEIGPWMLAGLVLAGVLAAMVSPTAMAEFGSGPVPVLVMAVVGIPLYICATAATPVAAAMLIAGVSPGAVATFLLAGPVTSLATLGVLRREMGPRVLALYLVGVFACTVGIGLGLNALVDAAGIDVAAQIRETQALLPYGVSVLALGILIALGIRPLRRRVLAWLPA